MDQMIYPLHPTLIDAYGDLFPSAASTEYVCRGPDAMYPLPELNSSKTIARLFKERLHRFAFYFDKGASIAKHYNQTAQIFTETLKNVQKLERANDSLVQKIHPEFATEKFNSLT